MMVNIDEYIREKWDETRRENKNDEDTLIGLPYSYTVPSARNAFNELYYWDTYFANKGLIIDGKIDLALNNCKNMLYLVEKYGYMPNGSRTWYIGRSQPPYLAMMIEDLYNDNGDLMVIKKSYETLKKEYYFWQTKRITANGLNRYYNDHTIDECIKGYNELTTRVKSPYLDPIEGGRNLLAEAESGWDFNARFGGMCTHYNPVDLNSNLYRYEKIFADFERKLDISSGEKWDLIAEERKMKINNFCWNENIKKYCDYNFTNKKISSFASAASFWAYFMGVADNSQLGGLVNVLQKLEAPFGIFTSEETNEKYQWGYPNVWAPCVYATVIGCVNYGLDDDARRIADKYIMLIENNYYKTGCLWEKYNALDGSINCINEYEMPEMMGWTAGVYKALKRLRKELK